MVLNYVLRAILSSPWLMAFCHKMLHAFNSYLAKSGAVVITERIPRNQRQGEKYQYSGLTRLPPGESEDGWPQADASIVPPSGADASSLIELVTFYGLQDSPIYFWRVVRIR